MRSSRSTLATVAGALVLVSAPSVAGAVRGGRRTVVDVLNLPDASTDGMPVADLVTAQHRWGVARARRLLERAGVSETRTVGALTMRQRHEVSRLLAHQTTYRGFASPRAGVARFAGAASSGATSIG